MASACAGLMPPGLNDRVECLAGHQLHHERRDLVGLFEAVHLRDVGMVERREQMRFALEPRAAIGTAGECARQDFDRDVAPELCVPRAIDLAHAARADPRLDLIDTQTASCQVHVRLGMATHQARDLLDGRPLNKTVGGVLIAQQRFDLLPECLVTRACLTKERRAIRCVALERCMAELGDLALPVGRHLGSRLASSPKPDILRQGPRCFW